MTKIMNEDFILPDSIDWNQIACFLTGFNTALDQEQLIRNQKGILVKRLKLMQHLNLSNYECNYWQLHRRAARSGIPESFTVKFTPIECDFELHSSSTGSLHPPHNKEWLFLQDLANCYSSEEDYSKLKVVNDRLKEVMDEPQYSGNKLNINNQ
jgi:hypothetical protein